MGGEEKLEDLYKDSMQVKKFALRSLRGHLAEVMPISLDDHILENILGHMISEEEGKFVRSSEEEKSVLTEMYRSLSSIYREMSSDLFEDPRVYDSLSEGYYSLLLNDLHKVVVRVYEEADMATTGDKESGKDVKETWADYI